MLKNLLWIYAVLFSFPETALDRFFTKNGLSNRIPLRFTFYVYLKMQTKSLNNYMVYFNIQTNLSR